MPANDQTAPRIFFIGMIFSARKKDKIENLSLHMGK
jgi:hypothetical protein